VGSAPVKPEAAVHARCARRLSMGEWPDSCAGETLYPDEATLARRVLGNRAGDWPAKAVCWSVRGYQRSIPSWVGGSGRL
jgi:hypothetical protein